MFWVRSKYFFYRSRRHSPKNRDKINTDEHDLTKIRLIETV